MVDLEQELAELDKQITEKVIEEPAPQAESPITQEDIMQIQVMNLFNKREDKPSKADREFWAEQYGKNACKIAAYGDDDVYIYRHLTRGEWKKLREVMRKLQNGGESDNEELTERLKERVVMGAILWPKLSENWLENSKAGVIDALYESIMLHSNFVTPQQAILFTTEMPT
jgi:hypothetical protein